MKSAFVDSFYWIATLDPRDEWHPKARALEARLVGVRLVTTCEVITEVLAFFAARGAWLRRAAADLAGKILSNPNISVVPQTRELFEAALRLYSQRPDKEWSLTDCISILVMQRHGITDALTHDRHFAEANFALLLE